jgi:plastocyanin
MKLLAIAAVAAAVAVPAATAAPAASVATKLTATVGPGFTITLTENGKKVTKLKPGQYAIEVRDESDQHDFHLFGPGVNKMTSITGETKTTWHVTLQKGRYSYMCDPHAAFMDGKFSVT